MNNTTPMEELKKAQAILMEAVDKSTRTNLNAVEKLLELNKQRFSNLTEATNPGDYMARQSSAFKDYAEQASAHIEALTAIGNESREQLTELSQEFTKGIDFTSFFPFGEHSAAKPKSKPSAKAA